MKKNTPVYPFSILPEDQQKKLAPHFSHKKFTKGRMVFEQDISAVGGIYILSEGLAHYFYDTGAGRILTGEIGPEETFGGLSILFNEAVSIRSLLAVKACYFNILPSDIFFTLCQKTPSLSDYFAQAFGRCMLNKSFAGILHRQKTDRQFNLPFFNRPIRSVFRPNITTCQTDDSIDSACKKMIQYDAGAILVKKGKQTVTGIVTDADLRHTFARRHMKKTIPVSAVMSSPVLSISADSQVFEAFLAMAGYDKRHLAVHSQSGDITGIISEKDLIAAQTSSTYLLIKTIQTARSIKDIQNIHSKIETMLLDPIKNGANPDYVTRLISAFSDAIIGRIITFALDKLGPAPCKFVFLTMGSEGREEQTLISDQDNAIIYEDVAPSKKADLYFHDLSTLICDHLDLAGYRYCEGDNMAKNPAWCQPLSEWKNYFNIWIRSSTPERLLHSSIFFDFRGTWGHMPLADELKQYLFKAVGQWSGFLRNLTENTLHFKPPIGLFGKLLVETQGKKKGALDIKLAMLPIVDFARIYALKNGIAQSNTLTRLFRLYTRHAITSKEYTDIVRSYTYLMNLRFVRQITAIFDEEREPDNDIYPQNLSGLDKMLLKEIFKMIEKLQQKLSIEFTGVV